MVAEARSSIERALAIFEAVHGPDHSDVATALIRLGGVQLRLGRFRAGRASMKRGIAILKAAHGPDSRDIFKFFYNRDASTHEFADRLISRL